MELNASIINSPFYENGTYCQDAGLTSPYCPVNGSTVGYQPSVPANAIFLAIFALCGATQLVQGFYYRTWTYMIAMGLGCLTELIGYIGRVMLHPNPYNIADFEMEIVCIIFAPAFFTAAIYILLKYIVHCYGVEFSRIRPKWYTWIFISGDIFSLVLQSAGGGIAASANDGDSIILVGNDIMITGIAWQVFTLIIFAGLVIDYFWRIHKAGYSNPDTEAMRSKRSFKLFLQAMIVAFVAIFIRCVYRIIEMAGGWGNGIQVNENGFIVLEGLMIIIAVILLTVFHPGYCFPIMRTHMMNKRKDRHQKETGMTERKGMSSTTDSLNAAKPWKARLGLGRH